ncbi:hypothetical protein GGR56DRAFT_686091 [Xylariaceae sp. FL0804]|nr:hypothetical protein GGR56DRAFT_686091 [Xylariaceae sp. FL0804]
MEQPESSSVIADKVAHSQGQVHRPSVGSGPSQASAVELPGPEVSSPVELPGGEVERVDDVTATTLDMVTADADDDDNGAGGHGSSSALGTPHARYHHHHHAFEPPPYSSPSDASLPSARHLPLLRGRSSGPQQQYTGLPVLDYALYAPAQFELSADATKVTSRAPWLSEDPRALAALLRSLATVPPKPQVLITGSRRSKDGANASNASGSGGGGGSSGDNSGGGGGKGGGGGVGGPGNKKLDFSVRLNLMPLLVPADARDRLDYLRCAADDEPAYRGGGEPALLPGLVPGRDGEGLEGWCARFAQDPAPAKSFSLERVVANLDTAWLERRIRALVAAADYRGHVAVAFPVTHARVVVKSRRRGSGPADRLLTSVKSLFTSGGGRARYEVAKAVWPFADAPRGDPGRRCLVQSEKEWWEEWRDPIKYAIATKRQGWVTNEDKLECIMESKTRGISLIDWGPDE